MRLRPVLSPTIMLAASALCACGGGSPAEPSAGPTQAARQATIAAATASGLNPDQRRRAESLMSIWENDQTTKAYAYAENIHDGRGVTWGWVGFTTADGDSIAVVDEFESAHPGNPLSPFLDQVHNRNVTDEAGFIQAVAASDQGEFQADFEAAQNHQSDLKYYDPALQQAGQLGLQTAAGIAELYDSEINHGPDGVTAIVNEVNGAMGGSPADGVDEVQWLSTYLDVRYRILAGDSTWKTSTDRATVFKSQIVQAGNLNLDGPIHIDSPQYGVFDIQ